ncbi:two-component system regulatory protein YycI [Bacillus piscicola]|uniref:two-component system regulatory protein YycI n=1 Tax=Bacillus piscicola TaxID=1632684 RepID=UPI001F09C94C
MDWSRTKTIFIIAFLLLNAFLLYQLIDKKNAGEINVRAQATVKERLAEMNITVTEELPEDKSEISHIVGEPMDISTEVITMVGEDNVHVLNNRFVEVTLDEPFPVNNPERDIDTFLSRFVWNEKGYVYSKWDSEDKQVFFHQTYKEHSVVTYDENQLVLFMNEDNEIESYIQSYLEFNEEGKEKDMLSPYKAIEVLLNDGIISFNDNVTKVRIGYYSLFKPEGEVQVFAPMYRIEVNEKSSYLVHAIDGSIQDSIGAEEDKKEDISEKKTKADTQERTS